MNKTTVFIAFVCLAALGIVGSVIILTVKPEAVATFTSLLITVLGLAVSAAVTFYGLGKQGEKLDQIKTQTNGTLSKLREENAALTRQLLIAHGADLSQLIDPERDNT